MSIITCPEFCALDREMIEDFTECLRENVESIEECLRLLDEEQRPNKGLINRLFRDVHSLKGNCRMVFLTPLVEALHLLEEIVSDMRQEKRNYHPAYGEFFMAVIEFLEETINTLVREHEVDDGPRNRMVKLIDSIVVADADNGINVVNQALIALNGTSETNDNALDAEIQLSGDVESRSKAEEDLAFFRKLSLQLDTLTPYREARTQTLLDLCLSTNEDLNHLVDVDQLTAAVYMHDLGMAMIPHDILDKPTRLTTKEVGLIHNHVGISAQLLHRMTGWDEAAEIVLQHHEQYNGKGYPLKLGGDNIHPGAMIIALADTFYAVTNERVDRSYKKSLFSAVTMINGESGEQFDPKFVEAFNETVRRNFIVERNPVVYSRSSNI